MKKIKLPELKIKVKATKGDEFYIKNSDDVVNVLRSIFNADTLQWTEEFILVCLNRAHKVIGYYKVGAGGFSGVVCDVKVIMTMALQSSASSLIVAHNHPSGNLKPSEADRKMTDKINGACKLLDINLLDHIILTTDSYYSFAEEGQL
jgi:DNA repair protein RadC